MKLQNDISSIGFPPCLRGSKFRSLTVDQKNCLWMHRQEKCIPRISFWQHIFWALLDFPMDHHLEPLCRGWKRLKRPTLQTTLQKQKLHSWSFQITIYNQKNAKQRYGNLLVPGLKHQWEHFWPRAKGPLAGTPRRTSTVSSSAKFNQEVWHLFGLSKVSIVA